MNLLNMFPSYQHAIVSNKMLVSENARLHSIFDSAMSSSFTANLKQIENQRQIQNENSRLQNKLTGSELIIQMQFDLLQRYCTIAELQQLSDLILKSRQKYGMNTKIMVDPIALHMGELDINEFVGGVEVAYVHPIATPLDELNSDTEELLAVAGAPDGTV